MSEEPRIIEVPVLVVEPALPTFRTVSEMGPWEMWFRFETLGTTAEEYQTASGDRREEINARTRFAITYLRAVPPAGCRGWMSSRRAAC